MGPAGRVSYLADSPTPNGGDPGRPATERRLAMNILESVSPRRLLLILVTFLTVWSVGALAQDLPATEHDIPIADQVVGEEDGSRFARLRYLDGSGFAYRQYGHHCIQRGIQ